MEKKRKIELMLQEIRNRGGLVHVSDKLTEEQREFLLQEKLPLLFRQLVGDMHQSAAVSDLLEHQLDLPFLLHRKHLRCRGSLGNLRQSKFLPVVAEIASAKGKRLMADTFPQHHRLRFSFALFLSCSVRQILRNRCAKDAEKPTHNRMCKRCGKGAENL